MKNDEMPRYRFRGSVKPSAEVSRPVAAYRNATSEGSAGTESATSATLDIFDVIDSYGGWWGTSATDVDAALKQIGDVNTLYVRLNSPGGEATEGVAIANLLRAHKATVRVTVYGIAASAASYIAIAGDTVNMGPGSLMFVHDAWDIALGDAADLRKAADTLDTISDSIAGLYVLKAGGDVASWRAAMHADTWYSAEAAVASKLADAVGIDPQMPAGLPPVETEDETDEDEATVIEIDVEISPAARAAARRFDLSMLHNAPAALAPRTQTPAEPPVTPPTDHKEADTMSDELIKGLRERFGFDEGADYSAILAVIDSARDPETTDEAIASARGLTAEQVTAALDAANTGKVAVSQAYLDSLKSGSEAGAKALARQQVEDRDTAIKAAQDAGKVGRGESEVTAWQAAYDRDPAGTTTELEQLGVRFPVAKTTGYAGHDDSTGPSAVFNDDEAAQLAVLAGISKEALTNG